MYPIIINLQFMGAFVLDLIQEIFDQDLEARQ